LDPSAGDVCVDDPLSFTTFSPASGSVNDWTDQVDPRLAHRRSRALSKFVR
jgi:hypothetical protein